MKVFRCRVCGDVYIGKHKASNCPFCGAHEDYLVLAAEWKLIKSDKLSDISKDFFKRALDLELDNTNFYKVASDKSKNIYFVSMFKGLSKIEREHASTICKHLGIEKPDSDVGLDKAVDSDSENIQEANRREKRAVKFYNEARSQAPEQEVKEFFKALIQIESDHIHLTE